MCVSRPANTDPFFCGRFGLLLSSQSVHLAIIQILIENLLGPKYCFILDDVDTAMNKAKFPPHGAHILFGETDKENTENVSYDTCYEIK